MPINSHLQLVTINQLILTTPNNNNNRGGQMIAYLILNLERDEEKCAEPINNIY